jgi:hypothetical protein
VRRGSALKAQWGVLYLRPVDDREETILELLVLLWDFAPLLVLLPRRALDEEPCFGLQPKGVSQPVHPIKHTSLPGSS